MLNARMMSAALFLSFAGAGCALAQTETPTRCPALPEAAGGHRNAHTRYVEENLNPAVIKPGDKPFTLAERMRSLDVPGISVAVIHEGRIDWARGWGFRDTAGCKPVTPDTAFQAASISKVATAMIALRLVEQGKLSLDTDINRSLRSWQLPADERLAPHGVTLRQLLSHTAGLGVHGFTGYPPGTPLPTRIQILDGKAPANSGPVQSVLPAGGQWSYSGGGYVVTQLLASDVSGMEFAALAQRELFGPLAMRHSAYDQPPAAAVRANIAFAHARGAPIPGNYRNFPEMGPAGLWTSASDLARLLIDIQASAAGKAKHRLSPTMTREMLTPVMANWGLGPAVYSNGARRFGHDGFHNGFTSFMVAYVDRGEGVVVLTNGGQGGRLINEVVRAIATDYGWGDIAPPATEELRLSRGDLAKVTGTFAGAGLTVTIEARPDGLFVDTGGPQPERLVALSATRFRTDARGIVAQFAADYSSFDIVEGGPPLKLARVVPSRSSRP